MKEVRKDDGEEEEEESRQEWKGLKNGRRLEKEETAAKIGGRDKG